MNNCLNKKDFYKDFKDNIKDNIEKHSLNLHELNSLKQHLILDINNKIVNGYESFTINIKSPLIEIYNTCKKFNSLHLYNEIVKLNLEISKELAAKSKYESYKINLADYCKFFDAYNLNGVKLLLKGLSFNIGGNCGKIQAYRVQRKGNTSRKLNHQASKKYKELLLSQGRIPYNKDDADRCAKEGIEYKGEDWRIYYYTDYYYYVDWKVYIPEYGEYYSFTPSRSYNLKITRSELIKTLSKPEDILNHSLGFIKYIYILDEVFPEYHTNFKSLSKI